MNGQQHWNATGLQVTCHLQLPFKNMVCDYQTIKHLP